MTPLPVLEANRRFVSNTARTGQCVCGRSLATHFDRRNSFISCDELAEYEAALASADACTTAERAAARVKEGRF